MSEEAGDEAEEGDGFESEVCYSVPHKVQCKLPNDILGRLINKVY